MNTRKIVLTAAAILAMTAGTAILNAQTPAVSGEAKTPSAKDANTPYYTCPMHPSARSSVPGKCPYCGGGYILITPHSINPIIAITVLLGIVGTAGYIAKNIFFGRSRAVAVARV